MKFALFERKLPEKKHPVDHCNDQRDVLFITLNATTSQGPFCFRALVLSDATAMASLLALFSYAQRPHLLFMFIPLRP